MDSFKTKSVYFQKNWLPYLIFCPLQLADWEHTHTHTTNYYKLSLMCMRRALTMVRMLNSLIMYPTSCMCLFIPQKLFLVALKDYTSLAVEFDEFMVLMPKFNWAVINVMTAKTALTVLLLAVAVIQCVIFSGKINNDLVEKVEFIGMTEDAFA